MSHVPAEFVGRARALRAEIAAADPIAISAAQRVAAPLCARLRRRPDQRPGVLVDAARHWRTTLPAVGRLDLSVDVRGKRLRIDETRLGTARFRADEWGGTGDESGLVVAGWTLDVTPGRVRMDHEPLAYISLHALARRFERAGPAPGDDLRRLGQFCAAPGEPGEVFRVPAAEGWWTGAAADVDVGDGEHVRMLVVRTFLVG